MTRRRCECCLTQKASYSIKTEWPDDPMMLCSECRKDLIMTESDQELVKCEDCGAEAMWTTTGLDEIRRCIDCSEKHEDVLAEIENRKGVR